MKTHVRLISTFIVDLPDEPEEFDKQTKKYEKSAQKLIESFGAETIRVRSAFQKTGRSRQT